MSFLRRPVIYQLEESEGGALSIISGPSYKLQESSRSKMAPKSRSGVESPALGVGPDYRPEEEKPTATVSKKVPYENVHILPQTPQLIALLT